MKNQVLGIIETNSIAGGFETLDAVVKKAPVTILRAEALNPGKFLLMFTGDLASAAEAMEAGIDTAGDSLIDQVFLTNLDEQVIPALSGCRHPEEWDALGLLETYTVASAVEAADRSVKIAGVMILGILSGNEMGGKALLKICGPVGDINAAMSEAVAFLSQKGQLCRDVIIPGPHGEIRGFVCGN